MLYINSISRCLLRFLTLILKRSGKISFASTVSSYSSDDIVFERNLREGGYYAPGATTFGNTRCVRCTVVAPRPYIGRLMGRLMACYTSVLRLSIGIPKAQKAYSVAFQRGQGRSLLRNCNGRSLVAQILLNITSALQEWIRYDGYFSLNK